MNKYRVGFAGREEIVRGDNLAVSCGDLTISRNNYTNKPKVVAIFTAGEWLYVLPTIRANTDLEIKFHDLGDDDE